MRISDYDNEHEASEKLLGDLLGLTGVHEMSWSRGGEFTRNLLSLQLQLQTLLEGVGGEGTASLLDGLAQLSDSERKRIIPLLSRVVSRVLKGEKRLMTAEDKELQDFEDSLFQGILASMGQSANDDQVDLKNEKKLEVLSGGKPTGRQTINRKPIKAPSLIDLAKARESRRQRFDTPPPEVS
jgi:hypothetical protein